MAPSETIAYSWVNGVESIERYKPGGYHPIIIHDILHNRYQIVDKLGYGGYSTIWLARDMELKRYVAIKVATSEPASQRESAIIHALNCPKNPSKHPGRRHMPVIWDEFQVKGPNGTHVCTVTAVACSDLKTASFSRLFPIRVARALAAAMANAVSYIHSQGFVHGDIRLNNVLVGGLPNFDGLSIKEFRKKYGEPEAVPIRRTDGKSLTEGVPSEAIVPISLGKSAYDFALTDAAGLILTDLGEAFEPDKEIRLGKDCNIPTASSSPEAWFEPESPLSYPSDIWSLATAIWDILGMKFLFSECEPPDEVAAEHIDVLGSEGFPDSWWKSWLSANGCTPRQRSEERDKWPPLDVAFEEYVQKYRRKRKDSVGVFQDDEVQAILRLMRGMLRFQPGDRLTADDVLNSEWMTKWALPELQQGIEEVENL